MDEGGRAGRIEYTGVMKVVVTVIAIGFSLYHLYTSFFGALPALQHRAIHLTFTLALLFLIHPSIRGRRRATFLPVDILLVLISIGLGLYIFTQYEYLSYRQGLPSVYDTWFGLLTTILVLESARRVVGWPMPAVAIFFILYGFFGRYFPGPFAHSGLSFEDIFSNLYVTLEGIFGVAIGVSATYIVVFVIFGAFLGQSGASDLFFNLAQSLCGTVRGGPAKVSVISSSLFGTVSGSAVANVMVDGWLTIPLMKKVGFKPHIAGAIEAVASTGGQIMPPIMGAAAFIMAEIIGVPYYKIALAAAIPALLYYVALFVVIDLEAAKYGLLGVNRSELPKLKDVLLSQGHLLLPLFVLILMLIVLFYTPMKSAFYSIIAVLLVSFIRKRTAMDLKKVIGALREGGINTISVASACACAGIIVGMFTITGLGMKLSYILIDLSGGKLLYLLIFTAMCNIILGMGMPTTAVYIILATLAAPTLIKLGVSPMASHLFVFYYGCLSHLTPPVALAAFAAAGIAESPPMKTGFSAWRIGLAGFIVPFMFVYGPALILEESAIQIIIACITGLVGVWALAISLEGYIFRSFPWWQRVFPFVGSLLLIKPGIRTDLVGMILFGVFLIYQRTLSKQGGLKKKAEVLL